MESATIMPKAAMGYQGEEYAGANTKALEPKKKNRHLVIAGDHLRKRLVELQNKQRALSEEILGIQEAMDALE